MSSSQTRFQLSMPPSLNTVHSIYIYSTNMQKIFSYYYQEPTQAREKFESQLLEKLFPKERRESDVFVVNKNELILDSVLSCLLETLALLFENEVNSQVVYQNYGSLLVIIDDMIDNGIILATEPEQIVGRITKAEEEAAPSLEKFESKVKKFFEKLDLNF